MTKGISCQCGKLTSRVLLLALFAFSSKTALGADVWMIDAATDQRVFEITDGLTISQGDLPDLLTISYEPAIEGGSFALELHGPESHRRVERKSPYTLYGNAVSDDGSIDYFGIISVNLPVGEYTIEVSDQIISFKVAGETVPLGTASERVWMVDARLDERLFAIEDGMQINLADIPDSYTLSFEPSSLVREARMHLTGPLSLTKTERQFPYSLFGDNTEADGTVDYNGSSLNEMLSEGEYNLTVNSQSLTFAVTQITPPPQEPVTVEFVDAVGNTFVLDDEEKKRLYSQDREEAQGIWSWATYQPEKASREKYPGLIAVPILVNWDDVSPAMGVYDWSDAEARMDAALADGLEFSLEFQVGHFTPEWVYTDGGVPRVETNKIKNSDTGERWTFPYYLSENYKFHFREFNKAIANFIKSLPPENRAAIKTFVINNGSTGDPLGYKGDPLDPQYNITEEKWIDFRIEHYQLMADLFITQDFVGLPIGFTQLQERARQFVEEVFPNVVHEKNGMASHGYHIQEPEALVDANRLAAFFGRGTANGERKIYFGEMDREWNNGWFQRAPAESFYWSALYALHRGLTRWQITSEALEQDQYDFAFDFFNKHAPHTNPSTSPYAFAALREGLNANDTVKFPEDIYGITGGKPVSRLLAIRQAYDEFGARVEDTERRASPFGFRQRNGYVDVFWGGVRANYNKFLYQIDPEQESVGWWHVGDKVWPYGRFARSFDSAEGKSAMYFQLDPAFVTDKEFTHTVKVAVTYFDGEIGEWELRYNSASGEEVAGRFQTNQTSDWKRVEITLPDALLNHGLDKGADFILRHVAGKDTKFHLIEIER